MPDDQILWFSKGRWALNELVLEFIKSKTVTNRIVLIPEYFCNISLTPLRKSGIKLCFYKINSQLEPDIDHLNTIIKTQAKPDILLFVHYFGIPLNLKPALSWCDEHRVLLVEDAAHTITPVPGIGGHSCPVIYTPWKFFNLLEGALLVLPQKLKGVLGDSSHKKGYSIDFWKWLAKRVTYTLAGRMKLSLHGLRKIDKKIFVKDGLSPFLGGSLCSSPFIAIITQLESKLEQCRVIRERNFRCLNSFFPEGNFIAEHLFPILPEKFGPYLYPLRIRNGRTAEIMTLLNRRGIPAYPWPDLSPEVLNASDFPVANTLRKEILTLPVHQDITESQSENMAREVINLL
ncbi:MAG: DegT/DnrJ/EryC1/StrS family aminotransferase [Sedimentisphaerales bacterium]